MTPPLLRFLATLLTLSIASIAAARELLVPTEFTSIQAALAESANGDVITVAPGTYTEPLDLLGKKIVLRSAAGPATTTLDGSAHVESIVSAVRGETLDTIVQGFTFANGTGTPTTACGLRNARVGGALRIINAGITVVDCVFRTDKPAPVEEATISRGGAIFACEADLAVSGSRFVTNTAGYGGAIYVREETPRKVTIEHSTFEGNRSGFGGAIKANLFSSSTMTISDCSFTGGEATSGAGVEIDAGNTARASITSSRFTGNRSTFGAGLFGSLADSSSLALAYSRFESNQSEAFGGGAFISARETATVDIAHCDITGNGAEFGGGLFATASGRSADPKDVSRVRVRASRFIGNVARLGSAGNYQDDCFKDGPGAGGTDLYFGGGADLRTYLNGDVSVESSLFAGNSGVHGGGAHASTCAGGTIAFLNCTIVDNAANGLHLRLGKPRTEVAWPAQIRVANSILWQNGTQIATEVLEPTSTATVVFSDVEGGFAGEGNIDVPPAFVDAASRDYHLATGSPGIDAGSNHVLDGSSVVDLDGRPRLADDPATRDTGFGRAPIVDLGAYEFQSEVPNRGRRRAVGR